MKRPIFSFENESDAKAVLELLVQEEINADAGSESDKEKTIYTVHIEAADQPAALEALGDEQLAKAVHCPACHGATVEFPARARASGIFNAIEKVGDAILPPTSQPFFCRTCSNQWN